MKYLYFVIYTSLFTLLISNNLYAIDGYSGFDGGISSGAVEEKETYSYQEVQFVSGEPILFEGTLIIGKSDKKSKVNISYNYFLKNVEKNATLIRKIDYITNITEKENNQKTLDTKIDKKFEEKIVINNFTYTLDTIDFMQSILVDKKPAVNYRVGNMWIRKNYSIKNTEGTNLGNVTVDITADIYGYNQYWSNTETILYKYLINGENIIDNASDKWGGEVDLTTSSSVSNELVYMKNAPEIISFTGGYINRQYNNNILEYTSSLPEFDQNNRATDLINKKHESYTIDSYPKQQRLMSVDFSELRGHWAELDIKKLFGLEVLTKVNNFKAEKTTTRGEYITRVYNCAKEIPIDPLFKKNKDNENKNIKYESPFKDVPNNHPDIKEIVESFNRGIIEGNGDGYFGLDENLKFIDAVVILVRVMGLDKINSLGRNVYFKDESDIPFYAKNAVNIAYRIGLIKGDNYGYLKPQEKLTNARSSALLVRFIDYLSEGIKDDYRDGILTY